MNVCACVRVNENGRKGTTGSRYSRSKGSEVGSSAVRAGD